MNDHEDFLVSEFCNVTGSDASLALKYLEMTSFDLDAALSIFYDSKINNSEENTLPKQRKPISPSLAILQDANFVPHASNHSTNNNVFGRSLRECDSEDSKTNSTVQRLSYLFRNPEEIIFKGTFEEARKFAKITSSEHLDFRIIIVTIHNPSEFICQAMNRDVWNNVTLQQIVKQSFVFCQLIYNTDEANRYTSHYQFSIQSDDIICDFPYVALIDPRTGEKLKEWIGKKWDATQMIEALVDVYESLFEPHNSSDLNNYSTESSSESDENDLNSLLIQLRLKDGSKIRRKFKQSSTIKDLFKYACMLTYTEKNKNYHDIKLTFTNSDGKTIHLDEFPQFTRLIDLGLKNATVNIA